MVLTIKDSPSHISTVLQMARIVILGYGGGLSPPLSYWEVVGSSPTASISRLGFFIQGRNSNGFLRPKMFRIYSPPNKITLWPICSHVLL